MGRPEPTVGCDGCGENCPETEVHRFDVRVDRYTGCTSSPRAASHWLFDATCREVGLCGPCAREYGRRRLTLGKVVLAFAANCALGAAAAVLTSILLTGGRAGH